MSAIERLALRAMRECYGRPDEDAHRDLAVAALEELAALREQAGEPRGALLGLTGRDDS